MDQRIGPGVTFGNAGGGWVSAILIAAFALLLVAGVLEARRITVPSRRRVLAGLRVVTALLGLCFSLQPQWIHQRFQHIEGRVAVLLDSSRSMTVRSGEVTRARQALDLLRDFRRQSRRPFDVYTFGKEATPAKLEDLDIAKLGQQDDTRLQPALERVLADLGEELGSIVLVSDGADLVPNWSPKQLRNFGVRVHTVSVGREELQDDAIAVVQADAVGFLRQPAQVEVSVRSSGARQATLPVTLREHGQIIAEAVAALDSDGRGKVVLPFTPARVGRAVYGLSIPLADGDAVPENNARDFLVRVTRDKLRILLLCGAPTWDTRFLRAFLKADPAIDLITFFILRTSSDLTMAAPEELSLIPFPTDELFREHLDSFDVVIFQDFDYGPYQVASHLPRIRDYVHKGGAFAMVGGTRSFGAGDYEHTPVAEVLPVKMAPGTTALSLGEFQPVVVETLMRHPLVELVPDPERNLKDWAELAPLAGANKLLGVREGAQVLLTHPSEKGAAGDPMPVLAVGSAGQGRVLALATDSTFRWGITTAGVRGDASAYDRFWDRALRWLSRDPLLDPAQVESDSERYGPGATLKAVARVRDERYQPLADKALELVVLDLEGAVQRREPAQSDGEGVLRGSIVVPTKPGAYRVAVRDPKADAMLAELGFLVGEAGDELAAPGARPDLLREIAKVTGGAYYDAARPPRLDELTRTRTRALGTVVQSPFRSPWWLTVLAVLFGTEWALRRAWGLR